MKEKYLLYIWYFIIFNFLYIFGEFIDGLRLWIYWNNEISTSNIFLILFIYHILFNQKTTSWKQQ